MVNNLGNLNKLGNLKVVKKLLNNPKVSSFARNNKFIKMAAKHHNFEMLDLLLKDYDYIIQYKKDDLFCNTINVANIVMFYISLYISLYTRNTNCIEYNKIEQELFGKYKNIYRLLQSEY